MSAPGLVVVAVDPDLVGMSRLADRLEAAAFLPRASALRAAIVSAKRSVEHARERDPDRVPQIIAVLPSNHPALIALAAREPAIARVAVYHSEPARLSRLGTAMLRASFAVVDLTIVPDENAARGAVRLGADPDRIAQMEEPIVERILSEPRRRDRDGALLEAAASLALDAAEMSGVVSLAERVAPDRGINVVNYHRVLPLEEHRTYVRPQMALAAPVFEAQLDTIAARGGFTRVERVREESEAGRVAITFDDGYEDNYRVALPILRQYDAPACVFVVTGLLGKGGALWWDRVGRALFHWWAQRSRPPLPEELAAVATGLGSAESIEEARTIISEALGKLNGVPEETRNAAIAAADRLAPPARDRTMLTWDEVAEMRRHGISFGSHTRTHVALDQVGPKKARDELLGSQADLEARLGAQDRICALPRGELGPLDEADLRAAGFSAVMTTEAGVNRPGDPSLFVHRRDGNMLTLRGRHHPAKLRLELTGLIDRLRKARGASR